MKTKVCSICKQALPLRKFGKYSRAKDGRMYFCRACKANIDADRRDKRGDHISAVKKKRARANPHLTRERNRRDRARKHGVKVETLPVDFEAQLYKLQHGNCFYCKRPLVWPFQDKKTHMDHKIPLPKGDHVRGNLCLACRSCNIKKGKRTPEEYAAHLKSKGETV